MMSIGARIRQVRLQRHLTLQEVAQSCGFTRSLLSKIERGRTAPPVATLTKIAGALGAGVSALMGEEREESCTMIRASEAVPAAMVTTRAGYSFFPFAGRRSGKLMQPYLFVAKKGKVKDAALTHAGEEFVFVLDGKMEYRVGAVRYTLGPGDALYFDSAEEHGLTPITAEVRYLAVFTESGEKNE